MIDLRSARASEPAGLAPLPATMVGRPFGTDEAGRPVGRTKGSFIRRNSGIHAGMCRSPRTLSSLPSHGVRAVRPEAVAQATTAAALEHLVNRLNAAIPEPALSCHG